MRRHALVLLLCGCASQPPVRSALDRPGQTSRAPDRREWERGRNLVVGGAGIVAVGGIFVGFSPLEISGGSPTGVETVVVGAALGAVGATLIVFGLRAMRASQPRPATARGH